MQESTSGERSGPSSSTVYTLRLSTSWDRGSAMSEPMAGVHVCLVGKAGSAILHRISPVNDPMDRLNMMRDICSSVSSPRLGGAPLGPAQHTLSCQHTLPGPHRPNKLTVVPRACFLQVGDEVGADCSILGSMDDPSNASAAKPLVIKQRFQVRAPRHAAWPQGM